MTYDWFIRAKLAVVTSHFEKSLSKAQHSTLIFATCLNAHTQRLFDTSTFSLHLQLTLSGSVFGLHQQRTTSVCLQSSDTSLLSISATSKLTLWSAWLQLLVSDAWSQQDKLAACCANLFCLPWLSQINLTLLLFSWTTWSTFSILRASAGDFVLHKQSRRTPAQLSRQVWSEQVQACSGTVFVY